METRIHSWPRFYLRLYSTWITFSTSSLILGQLCYLFAHAVRTAHSSLYGDGTMIVAERSTWTPWSWTETVQRSLHYELGVPNCLGSSGRGGWQSRQRQHISTVSHTILISCPFDCCRIRYQIVERTGSRYSRRSRRLWI